MVMYLFDLPVLTGIPDFVVLKWLNRTPNALYQGKQLGGRLGHLTCDEMSNWQSLTNYILCHIVVLEN